MSIVDTTAAEIEGVLNRFMRLIIGGFIGLIVMGCGNPQSAAGDRETFIDPLAPARNGMLLCIKPVPDQKHCNTIAKYNFNNDGSVLTVSDITMSEAVVMSTRYISTIKGDKICSVGTPDAIQGATFTIYGEPATTTQSLKMRKQMLANLEARQIPEHCIEIVSSMHGKIAHVTVGDVRVPEMDEPIIWVDPADGFIAHP